MIKSIIRKKILKIRKKNYYKNYYIDPFKILNIFKANKIKIKNIGLYYPYNYEIDTQNISRFLIKKNYKISLPRIGRFNQMNFYNWSFKDPLAINSHGIAEPISENIVNPDVLIIPIVAFDKNLFRLGYGGGYYDRYIARRIKKKKITTIGLAYTFQKVNKLPVKKHDIKLNFIVTEKDILK